jgi:hypothetical protein
MKKQERPVTSRIVCCLADARQQLMQESEQKLITKIPQMF